MRAAMLPIVLAVSSLLFLGCSSSTKHRIPNPDAYELKDGIYHVALKKEWTYTTSRIRVERDSAFFNDKKVRLDEIRSIETKEFSAMKTFGLLAGVGAAGFLLIQVIAAYALIYGHSASK